MIHTVKHEKFLEMEMLVEIAGDDPQVLQKRVFE
jgi:hypothetical protein